MSNSLTYEETLNFDDPSILIRQMAHVPKITNSTNLNEWMRTAKAWLIIFGLKVEQLLLVENGTSCGLSKRMDLTLFGTLLQALEGSPLADLIQQNDNDSGVIAWQLLSREATRNMLSTRNIAINELILAARTTPAADSMQAFSEFEARTTKAFAAVRAVLTDVDQFTLSLYLGSFPLSSPYADTVAHFNELDNGTLSDFLNKTRALHAMRCNQIAMETNQEQVMVTTEARHQSSQASMIETAVRKALQDQFQGKRPARYQHDHSRCNRCGEPVTSSHTSRTCPNCNPDTKCTHCGKLGHLAHCCRSQRKVNPTQSSSNYLSSTTATASVATVLDSGATKSVATSSTLLSQIFPGKCSKYKGLTNDVTSTAAGLRTYEFYTDSGDTQSITLPTDVIPSSPHNLLSVSALNKQGWQAFLTSQDPHLLTATNAKIPIEQRNGLFVLPSKANNDSVALMTIQHAHERFGHRNEKSLIHTAQHVKGLDIDKHPKGTVPTPCFSCAAGKLQRTNVTKGPHAPRTTGPYQAFSIDATGIKVTSRYGNRYAHCAKDLHTSVRFVFCTPTLSGPAVVVGLAEFLAQWLPAGHPTRSITYHADSAYLTGGVEQYLHNLGMVPHGAAPDEHSTHGQAERDVGLLDNAVTTLLADSRLPPNYWEDAARHYAYTSNRLSPTKGGQPPLRQENPDLTPDVTPIHRFGALAYFRDPLRKKHNFGQKGRFGLYLGVAANHTHGTLRILALDTRRITLSRSAVIFDRTIPGEYPDQSRLHRLVTQHTTTLPAATELRHASFPADMLPSGPVDPDVLTPGGARGGVSDEDSLADVSEASAPEATLPGGALPSALDNPHPDGDLCGSPGGATHLPQCHCSTGLTMGTHMHPLSCDTCHMPIPARTPHWGCTQCDIDTCTTCVSGSDRHHNTRASSRHSTLPSTLPANVEEVNAESAHEEAQTTQQPEAALVSHSMPTNHIYEDPAHPVQEPLDKPNALRHLPQHDKQQWLKADKAELDGLVINKTLQELSLDQIPSLEKVYPCKMVRSKKKPDVKGRVRLKSRIVVRGDLMRNRTPTQAWSAPVANSVIPKVMIIMALTTGTKLAMVDISQAFLKSSIHDDDIYVKIKDEHEKIRFYKLLGSLYGIPSAPGRWAKDLGDSAASFGLIKSMHDPCLFISKDKSELISTHVDDIMILMSEPRRSEFIKHLETEFGTGSATTTIFEHLTPTPYLGITWTMDYENKACFYNQQKYIDNLLESFDMENSKPVATPAVKEHLPAHSEDESHPMYQTWTGSLNWLAGSRPDIQHAVMELNRHNKKNGRVHERAVKHLLRYLNGTRHLQAVLYGANTLEDLQLQAYSDASYAQCEDTRKSTSGIMLTLLDGIVLTKSKLQKTVAISACESELYAMFECALHIIALRQLLEEMGLKQEPTALYSDSQSAMKLLDRPNKTPRSKHLDVRWHKLKELKDQRQISLMFMPTAQLPADPLTKSLDKSNFVRHRDNYLFNLPSPTTSEVCQSIAPPLISE